MECLLYASNGIHYVQKKNIFFGGGDGKKKVMIVNKIMIVFSI